MLMRNIENTLNLTVIFRDKRSIKEMKSENLKNIENKQKF